MKFKIKHSWTPYAFDVILKYDDEDTDNVYVCDVADCFDAYYGGDRIIVEYKENSNGGKISVNWDHDFKRLPTDEELMANLAVWISGLSNKTLSRLKVDWRLRGRLYAYYWEPIKYQFEPYVRGKSDKEEFNKGYTEGWQLRGQEDAKSGQPQMTEFRDDTAKENYIKGWTQALG